MARRHMHAHLPTLHAAGSLRCFRFCQLALHLLQSSPQRSILLHARIWKSWGYHKLPPDPPVKYMNAMQHVPSTPFIVILPACLPRHACRGHRTTSRWDRLDTSWQASIQAGVQAYWFLVQNQRLPAVQGPSQKMTPFASARLASTCTTACLVMQPAHLFHCINRRLLVLYNMPVDIIILHWQVRDALHTGKRLVMMRQQNCSTSRSGVWHQRGRQPVAGHCRSCVRHCRGVHPRLLCLHLSISLTHRL